MAETFLQTQKAHAPGRHQRSGQRSDYRGYPDDGMPWGQNGWESGVAPPAPAGLALTTLTPTTGVVFVEAALTITGSGFVTGAVAYTGAIAMTNTVVVSPTSITCSFLPTAAMSYDITVHNPDAQVSNALVFTSTAAQEDVLDGTIDDVKAYVNGLANNDFRDDIIQNLLDRERANRNRATLVTWLDQQTGVT